MIQLATWKRREKRRNDKKKVAFKEIIIEKIVNDLNYFDFRVEKTSPISASLHSSINCDKRIAFEQLQSAIPFNIRTN